MYQKIDYTTADLLFSENVYIFFKTECDNIMFDSSLWFLER